MPHALALPDDLDTAIQAMLTDVMESVTDRGSSGAYTFRVRPVENEGRSGFVPWTNGGYDGRATASLIRVAQEDSCSAAVRDLAEGERAWFFRCYAAHLAGSNDPEAFTAEAGREAFYSDLNSEDRSEDAQDFESDHWGGADDSAFFYDARAMFYAADNMRNETGADEVYLFAAVNVDLDYGRDSIPWLSAYGSETNQHRGAWDRTIKIADLTPDVIDQCGAEMARALLGA